MNLDEQIRSGLAGAATGADAAPPTRAGVQAAIEHRTVRRRRRRVAVSTLASLCLAAGLVGGFVLGRGGTSEDGIVATPDAGLPDVPLLGVDLPGWELLDAYDSGGFLGDDPGTPPVATYAFFRQGSAPFGAPVMAVTVGPPDLLASEGETPVPIDLDGDGRSGGPADGWRLPSPGDPPTIAFTRGTTDTVATTGFGVDVDDVVAYVSALRSAGDFTIDDVPPPDGYAPDVVTALPLRDARLAYSTFRIEDGGTVYISVTNQPGWSAISQYGSSTEASAFEVVPLGDSFLGPGVAALTTTTRHPGPTGLIITDAGLTIEITTDALRYDPDIVRRLITDAPFVEVEPTNPAVPTATTNPYDAAPEIAIDEDGCPAEPGTPTSLADEPSWADNGQFQRWRDLAGCPVRIDVISSIQGAAHCGWEDAQFVTIGRPLGAPLPDFLDPATANRYVFNPNGVVPSVVDGRFIRQDELPPSASDTGYRLGPRELWLDPDDEASLYVLSSGVAQVFVRDFDGGLCA